MDTFLWHDYETFGADPRRDRPAQFAALRTDADLEPVGEPINIYCRPADDVLPHPDACLITGITPQLARDKGLKENEFSTRVAEALQKPGTCGVGYNNFRFDDEITRHLFWRNFHDPYAHEWANGNSRFDLIDLMRMTRALRPEGLQWPNKENGNPSFRLEDLAAANGLDTRNAHDALADVYATLGLARRVRQAQPRLWQWALTLRHRHSVTQLFEPRKPLLHSSARLPAEWCATAPVLPLDTHPTVRSQWIVWNLRESPEQFLRLQEEALADLLWTPAADLPDGQKRLPVKIIRTNRCPMVAPMNVLDGAAADRLAIDRDAVVRHFQMLRDHSAFTGRLRNLFRQDGAPAADPELSLYSEFPPKEDLPLRNRIRQMQPDQLSQLDEPFRDCRLNELLFRYRARLWPESLTASEKARWQEYRRKRLIDDPELASISLTGYRQRIDQLMATAQGPDLQILQALMKWPEDIGMDPGANEVSTT